MLSRARQRIGPGALGRMIGCFYCLSVWVAAPFTAARNTAAAPAGPRPAQVTYQYTATTGLTVTRTPTGASYRFAGPGARVLVDARDRAALASIPVLRLVG